MDDSKAGVWFFGDAHDPFVALIADSTPDAVALEWFDAAGPLPQLPLGESAEPPRAVVAHRHSLATTDLKTLEQWRDQLGPRTPIVVCVSPFARYAEIARANRVVDAIVPEATAVDSMPARLERLLGLTEPDERPSPSFRIEVSCGLYELGRVIVETCERAEFKAELVDDLVGLAQTRGKRESKRRAERVLTIWEVPLLDPGWREALVDRVRATGPVIAVFAFADREAVTTAWDAGAAACLDAPGDFELLADVISWTARSYPLDHWPVPARLERAHPVPPTQNQETTRERNSIVASEKRRPRDLC